MFHLDPKVCLASLHLRRRFLLLAAAAFSIALLSVPALALDPSKSITQYVHASWGIKDGLKQKGILCIKQTRDGYLWLGTQEGLIRFDGVQFEIFTKSNVEGLKHNYVWTMLEDRQGNLWIGTYGGLTKYRDGKFTTYTTKEGLSHDMVRAICESRDGSLWIGTNEGLNRFKDGKFTTYSSKDGLAGDYVRAIC